MWGTVTQCMLLCSMLKDVSPMAVGSRLSWNNGDETPKVTAITGAAAKLHLQLKLGSDRLGKVGAAAAAFPNSFFAYAYNSAWLLQNVRPSVGSSATPGWDPMFFSNEAKTWSRKLNFEFSRQNFPLHRFGMICS